MKTKTIFSEFQLYVDDEVKFFEYCKVDGHFFARPLAPYLKNECFEIYRKENMNNVFVAVVQIRIGRRQLLTDFMDVLGKQRQYKLLDDVLAYSEKVNIRNKGCSQDVYAWKVFAPDAFGDLKDVTKNLLCDNKRYISTIERQGNILKLGIRSIDKTLKNVYFEREYANFQPISEKWLEDVIDAFQKKQTEHLLKEWQILEDEMFI